MRNIRLFVNTGMSFPICRANDRLLNLDAGRYPMTNQKNEVTCKHCINILERLRQKREKL